jgi:two-component system, sensor histidine kinase and response regulator
MDDYLCKPFKQDQLRAILERWLPEISVEGEASDAAKESISKPRLAASIQPQSDESSLIVDNAISQASPIDNIAIDNIRALGKPNLLEKLIKMFFSDAPKLLESMRQAAEQGDATTLASAAHRLKSSSANLGAVKLAALCVQTEMLGRENRAHQAHTLLSEMYAEFQSVRLALETAES